jgi:hypothetical protein
MINKMTFDDWWNEFQPIDNPFQSKPSFFVKMFETYGEELEFVQNQPADRVWTELDDNTIVNGYHIVNRFGYYVTREPWDKYTEVMDVDLR